MATFEVKREEEFSPVKNAPGNPVDSPDSARMIISNYHKTWITRIGGKFVGDGLCEVSPLVSFDGSYGLENFEKMFRESNREVKTPCLFCLSSEYPDIKGNNIFSGVGYTYMDGVHYYITK